MTTPLILTGLAVAFAFRCGMFNIGGQGQYTMGAITAVWVGTTWASMPGIPHAFLAIVLAMVAGALWAGIAGILKATVGAHEVITTIMLNWIAYWVGTWAFGLGGPLQNDANKSVPISNDVLPSVKLPVWWGNAELQGLHIGFFIALAALVAYWFILNRTTLGYEVRAVGYNPEAARYAGINVARSYFLAMAIAGGFAGLGGALDILGWQYRLGSLDIQTSQIGFIGIAVALLGRNTAIGVGLSALLFGALLYGTSTRSLDPDVFPPELAGNLTLMIQALVLLFVGADAARRLRLERPSEAPQTRGDTRRGTGVTAGAAPCARASSTGCRVAIGRRLGRRAARAARVLRRAPAGHRALAGLADPVRAARDRGGALGGRPAVWGGSPGARSSSASLGIGLGYLATLSGEAKLDSVVVWSALFAAMLRYATPLDVRGDRRHLQRALRRREHRPRGDDADGRVLRDPRCGQARLVAAGAARRARRRRADGADPRVRLDPPARRPDRERHGDQLPRARRHRLLLHRRLRRPGDARWRNPARPGGQPRLPRLDPGHRRRSSRTCSAIST